MPKPDRGRARSRSAALEWVAGLVGRRPRTVIGVWLILIAILGAYGSDLGQKLTSEPVYVNGSSTKREHEIIAREFGGRETMVVVLHGPPRAVDRQGRRLAENLRPLPRSFVVSPWMQGETVEGLRPKPGVAALLVNAQPEGSGQLFDVLTELEHRVDSTLSGPVHASITGGPTIVESYKSATEDAVTLGERVALPVLLIVLLLVFRSVLAAAIPVLVGGAVVAASKGVINLLLNFIHIEAFALGALGMMGLALGVDYSLLFVSRFREEMQGQGDVSEAVRVTVNATGRTVIPAGCGLIFAMLVASQVVHSPAVVSAATAFITVAVLSVLSAMFVVPAALALLGGNLDRFSLPGRSRAAAGGGMALRWSQRISGRPVPVLVIVWALLVCAGLAFTLDSRVGTIALLPASNRGRQQQEEVQRYLGPGWVGGVEIAIQGRGRPVTTPQRLRALAAFQRRVEGDSDVGTVAGLAPIERNSEPLQNFEGSLVQSTGRAAKLAHGLAAARGASAATGSGMLSAAGGARSLDSALGATSKGAGSLADGIDSARNGSRGVANGLEEASGGSGRLAQGVAQASAGSQKLAGALAKAEEESVKASSSARPLKKALHAGETRLGKLSSPLSDAEQQLATAERGLKSMTSGRGDPQYAGVLHAVETAIERLTGTDPGTGESPDPSFEGVGAGVESARQQFGLGIYLANREAVGQRHSRKGIRKLAKSADSVDEGLDTLTKRSRELASGVMRLSEGGSKVPRGLQRLALGATHLAAGLGSARGGAGDLADGLGAGGQRVGRLTGALGSMQAKTENGLSGSSLDRLRRQSPGLFHSGYFLLAGLDGSKPGARRGASFLINLDRGGLGARMLVIPRSDPGATETVALIGRLQRDAAGLARETHTDVAVGGVDAVQADMNSYYRDQAPLLRIALSLVTILILLFVARSLAIPVLAAVVNVVAVAASFGLLSLFFDHSLLGGPGYVDAGVIPATIVVMFGLAIDYEVFIVARMREEYVRTGSPQAALTNGLAKTAHVVTGAAVIMIAVFVAFALSEFMTVRDFGVAQAIGVAIDAFVIRLVVMPAAIRAMGKWAWWIPPWLDRILPGGSPVAEPAGPSD